MNIKQTNSFKAVFKKLHSNQRQDLEKAIKNICSNPEVGVRKQGDLAGVYVHKFRMNNSLTLLAYTWDEEEELLILLNVGSHENFYRDLK